jgi:hypothetical protein
VESAIARKKAAKVANEEELYVGTAEDEHT